MVLVFICLLLRTYYYPILAQDFLFPSKCFFSNLPPTTIKQAKVKVETFEMAQFFVLVLLL